MTDTTVLMASNMNDVGGNGNTQVRMFLRSSSNSGHL